MEKIKVLDKYIVTYDGILNIEGNKYQKMNIKKREGKEIRLLLNYRKYIPVFNSDQQVEDYLLEYNILV